MQRFGGRRCESGGSRARTRPVTQADPEPVDEVGHATGMCRMPVSLRGGLGQCWDWSGGGRGCGRRRGWSCWERWSPYTDHGAVLRITLYKTKPDRYIQRKNAQAKPRTTTDDWRTNPDRRVSTRHQAPPATTGCNVFTPSLISHRLSSASLVHRHSPPHLV